MIGYLKFILISDGRSVETWDPYDSGGEWGDLQKGKNF